MIPEEWAAKAISESRRVNSAGTRLEIDETVIFARVTQAIRDAVAAVPMSDDMQVAYLMGVEAGKAQRWIACSERLPERGTTVLTYTPPGETSMGGWYRIVRFGVFGGGFPSGVTAWQPLAPPED